MNDWILPGMIAVLFLWAMCKGVNAYQSFVQGVKEGLELFVSIYPAMLAMLFMVAVLEKGGLMAAVSQLFQKWIPCVPSAIWPMAFFRPISGNASLAVLHSIFINEGVDSLSGFIGSILQGATDTTFYVIALYFGSVGIRKIKNSLVIGIIADIAGICAAIVLGLYFFQEI
ncbi:spore maturation protein [Merdibacter massiliensis]|uniref:spore maturation protein n=1 Tax=Merdibacter massiliensis TaxID=1871030 RepID=UPI001F1D5D14|nr:spore maturation protein [Merdibacter massiliensis]